MVFEIVAFNPLLCLIKAKKATAEWSIGTCLSVDSFPRGHLSPPIHKNFIVVRWVSPPPGLIKVNFAGTCIDLTTIGGFLLRDWTCRLIQVGACNYGTASIIVVEAQAMRDGILMAIQAGFQHILVKSDNKLVIQATTGSNRAPWHLFQLLQDIKCW